MFSANDVKVLREKTGAGMLDCKKALDETKGDMEKAIDFLREKGIAKANKKTDRIAAEGLSQIFENNNELIVLEVNSETDFVAKNEEFRNFVKELGEAILKSSANTMDEVLEVKMNDVSISDAIISITAKLGEKISFRRFSRIVKTDKEVFGTYSHMGGKISTVIVLEGSDKDIAREVAMHATAMHPLYLNETYVPSEVLEKEKEIMREQLLNEGKPSERIENILVGKVRKYYEEVCLENQIYVKAADKETVKDFVNSNGGKIITMIRYEVGEGIEKRKDDFASEVMNQIKG